MLSSGLTIGAEKLKKTAKTTKTSILLVEDEKDQRALIKAILEAESYQVTEVETAEDAIEKLRVDNFEIVISDWKLPGLNGDELLAEIRENHPQTGFILITAHSDASHAISIIRAGADDYLPKPFDRASLLFTVSKLVYTRQIENENKELKTQSKHRNKLLDMIGNSSAMNRLFLRIEKTAPTNATILITGESGTGKELAARAIHQLSSRKEKLFLPVNCAAIPESLAESELFGAEKGAYTGSNKNRVGKLEAASEGTIFLDEIGELPLILQSKLLRFLQEGTITRVGSNQEISLDVRVVTATNRDLLEEVKQGNFREDLFYRLNVIPVTIPPLRNRQDDLLPLIKHFITIFTEEHGVGEKQLSSAALKYLLAYSWPGNVRQLRNSIERLVLLSYEDVISLQDVEELELHQRGSNKDYVLPSQGISWESHEKDCLLQALSHCNNNRTQAAKLLGLSYKAFLYRLEKHNIN
ncbi:sigma-54-dependent transcriptional regulator [Aliikangiella coralliicola]|uniref:Sigma-54-dependent Fis family transcriptional regulator n=1 Tax=Aliikangiella coralliicola TaxID=2592383 RepID=A0A545UD29_9GAMM|nr:sigma-54 dependent transcriptional regulator [Aliikangiella coralliicola]TQV87343.1 sigma-54-dependent Fis family transcriptional regulator [Aliikangiella coralliicola]